MKSISTPPAWGRSARRSGAGVNNEKNRHWLNKIITKLIKLSLASGPDGFRSPFDALAFGYGHILSLVKNPCQEDTRWLLSD
jgi:hypothetical protein